MRWTEYLSDRLFSILCLITACLISAGLLWLIEVRSLFILYFELIFIAAFCSVFLWDFTRRRKYYNRLLATLRQLDVKTLLAELAEPAHFADGKIVANIIRQSNQYMNNQLAEADRLNREYREYIELWVHEVKTPITSAYLMIENDKNLTTLRINDELHKIDRFVEQALFYARSTALEKDFTVERMTLQDLVRAAVKAYSKPVIQARGQLHFENLAIPVSADSKWCAFIIGQLIANAVQYRQDDFHLTFTGVVLKNGVRLLISDNGIGVSAADLPRVFDKGFTGENGRRFGKSTGIGLYLSKTLCRKMNMEISMQSTPGAGTTVTLYFPEERFLP